MLGTEGVSGHEDLMEIPCASPGPVPHHSPSIDGERGVSGSSQKCKEGIIPQAESPRGTQPQSSSSSQGSAGVSDAGSDCDMDGAAVEGGGAPDVVAEPGQPNSNGSG